MIKTLILLTVLPVFYSATRADTKLRFLFPKSPYHLHLERELRSVIQGFNELHPNSQVALILKGEDFSSLRELIVSSYAGNAPEIAVVAASEGPALEKVEVIKKIKGKKRRRLFKGMPTSLVSSSKNSKGEFISIPFSRFLPILVVNQEILFRHYIDPHKLPKNWKEVEKLLGRLKEKLSESGHYPGAFPLGGTRGLWVFEALLGRPLWKRKAGGLAANRKILPDLGKLRKFLQEERSELKDWKEAIEDFIDRKTPILVTATDSLPVIQRDAKFRWKFTWLPAISKPRHRLGSGMQLVLTQDKKEIWTFLDYLYSTPVGARLALASGGLPIKSSWQKSKTWKTAKKNPREFAAQLSKPRSHRLRTTDSEVVRARTEWQNVMEELLDPEKSPPKTLTELDNRLSFP